MHEVLRAIGDGEAWAVVTGRQFSGMGSWGNGAAPEATAGAVAVAAAVALSVQGIAGSELIGAVADRTPDSEVASRLRRADRIAPSTDPRHAAAMLGCGKQISAVDTVPYTIWCAARHLDDLTEALWATALAGGDVDTTIAARTRSALGAYRSSVR